MENEFMEAEKNKESVALGALLEAKRALDVAIELFGGEHAKERGTKISSELTGEARILEGVFSGEAMIGDDGQKYQIPHNYASKSKLVEGDMLKLTITTKGNFIYKQIKLTNRKRMTGELIVDEENDEHWVVKDNFKWRALKASVTYYKGQSGDKVIFLVPEEGASKWATVEGIYKNF